MNARFRKEIRELLPAFVITVLLVGLPFFFGESLAEVLPFLALALGAAALGGISFGAEFQRRTFPMLLSQPVSRVVLWREKMLVLGVCLALVSAWATVLNGWIFRSKGADGAALFLIPLCAFSGAPLLTLLARNGIAGGVFAIALPGLLIAGAVALAPHGWFVGNTAETLVVVILLLYCCAAYWLGNRVFKTAQAIDGGSGELELPAGLERVFAQVRWRRSGGPVGPLAALLKKELRLQWMVFLIAGVFVVVALAGALLWRVRPESREWAEWIIGADFMIYVSILPLLVGAVAFAEERGWGTSDWHLTLPPSAFKQWTAKLVTVLPVSLLLGVILPGALFFAGYGLIGERTTKMPEVEAYQGWLIFLSQLLVMSVAAHAGSFSSGTLKAMLVALGVLLAGVGVAMLVFAVTPVLVGQGVVFIQDPVHPSWRFAIRGLLLLLGLLLWFSFHNFRRCDAGLNNLAVQWGTVLGVLALLVALFRLRYFV
ncbi:MAG TPA: hypothetical protein VJA21_18075 [Verrucomicrobiae bacterium]